jgi:hypothetical protein
VIVEQGELDNLIEAEESCCARQSADERWIGLSKQEITSLLTPTLNINLPDQA